MAALNDNLEELGAGIQRQWLCEGRIIGIYMTRDGTDTLEVWTVATKEAFDTWQPGKPYLSLYDISKNNFTPIGVRRAEKIARKMPHHIRGYTAVVIAPNMVGRIFKDLIGVIVNRYLRGKIETRFVFSRREGLRWLESKLNDSQK